MSSNLKPQSLAALALLFAGVSGSPLFFDSSCPSSCIPILCDSNVQVITSYITVLPEEIQTQTVQRPNSIPPHSYGNEHGHLVAVVPIPAATISSYNHPNGEFPPEQIHSIPLPTNILTTTEYQTVTLTQTRTHHPNAYAPIGSPNTYPTTLALPSPSDKWVSPDVHTAWPQGSESMHTHTRTHTRKIGYGSGTDWDVNSAVVTERPSPSTLPAGDGEVDTTYTITSADVRSGTTRTHIATGTFRPHFHNSEPQFGPKAASGHHVSTETTQSSCTAPSIVYYTTTQTLNFLTVETAKPTEEDSGSSNGVHVYERERVAEHVSEHENSFAKSDATYHSDEGVHNLSHEKTPFESETLWKRWYRFGKSPSIQPTISSYQKPNLPERPVEAATAYYRK